MPLIAFFPLFDLSDPGVKKIHNNLSDAINNSIVPGTFVPGNFTTQLMKNITPDQKIYNIFTTLATAAEVVIAAALAATLVPGNTPATAWKSVSASILTSLAPPELAGPAGPSFWLALLATISNAQPGITEILI